MNIAKKHTQLNSFGYLKVRTQKGWTYGSKKVTNLGANYKFNQWINIKIHQENKFLSVEIDNEVIMKSKIEPIRGNMISIQNCLKSEFLIDNIKIEKQKKGR